MSLRTLRTWWNWTQGSNLSPTPSHPPSLRRSVQACMRRCTFRLRLEVMAIKMTAMLCYMFHYSKQVKFDSEKTRQEFPFRKKLCQTSFLGHSRLDMCTQFCIFLGAQTNGNKLFEYTHRLTTGHALVIGYDQGQLVQKIWSNIWLSIAHFKSTRKSVISFFCFYATLTWME